MTATNNHNRSTIGGVSDCFCDSDRAFVEGRLFENSHRAVPNDRLRVGQGFGEVAHSFDSNVHARVTRVGELDWNRLSHHLVALDWLITVDDLMVSREQQFNSRFFAPRLDLPRLV